MTEEERRRRAAEQSAQIALEGSQAVADAQAAAEAQRQADTAAAQEALNARYNAIQSQYANGGSNYFADVAQSYNDELRRAEKEAEAETKANNAAARWTGLGELAASIVNMVGVGSYNSANQQYHSFSQDWMKKADADLRAQRQRVANLRERQRGMQAHIAQLKMADARQNQAAALAQADADYKARMNEIAAQYKGSVAPVLTEQEGRLKAADILQKDADVAARNELTRRGQNIQAQSHRDSLAQRDKQFAAQMAAKGFNADGSVNVQRMSELSRVSRTSKGSGSSSGLRLSLTASPDGLMPEETMEFHNPKSLFSTIQANINNVGLSDSDKKAVDRILKGQENEDEKAKKLLPYVVYNPDLRRIVRRNADASDYAGQDYSVQYNEPAAQGKESAKAGTSADAWAAL